VHPLALAVEVEPAGAAVTVDGAPLLPPAATRETFVKPDARHVVRIVQPGFVEQREDLSLRGGERRVVHARLVEGGTVALAANLAARVFVDERWVGTAPISVSLPEGRHAIGLRAQRPFLDYKTVVTIERGKTLAQRFDFGTVAVKAPGVVAERGDGRGVTDELALPPGTQRLALVNEDTGERREREVDIKPGSRLVIDSW
jgi:hypothetical protein